MTFNDYIAKQPIDIIINTKITDTTVRFPTMINTSEFYRQFKSEIESNTLTTEKCLYLASIFTSKHNKFINSIDLLNNKLFSS